MIVILLLIYSSTVLSRDISRRNSDDQPFSITNNVFSEEVGQTFSESELAREFTKEFTAELSESQRFTGPTPPSTNKVNPPGLSPQPPSASEDSVLETQTGKGNEKTAGDGRVEQRSSDPVKVVSLDAESPALSLEQFPTLSGFLPTPPSLSDPSSDSEEDDTTQHRLNKNAANESSLSSSESDSSSTSASLDESTTGSYDPDSLDLEDRFHLDRDGLSESEGSGSVDESHSTETTTEQSTSDLSQLIISPENDLFDVSPDNTTSTDSTSVDGEGSGVESEEGPLVKVSGEIGVDGKRCGESVQYEETGERNQRHNDSVLVESSIETSDIGRPVLKIKRPSLRASSEEHGGDDEKLDLPKKVGSEGERDDDQREEKDHEEGNEQDDERQEVEKEGIIGTRGTPPPPPPLDELLIAPLFSTSSSSKKSKKDRTPARRGAVDGCPSPRLCAKNCFVSLDEQGCQSCQCLWQAIACEVDIDCPESIQTCDLGKCDCIEGYVQDMSRSGLCKRNELSVHVHDSEELSLKSLGVERTRPSILEAAIALEKGSILDEEEERQLIKHKEKPTPLPASAYFGAARLKRSAEKPRSAERLQWPGRENRA